MSIFSTTARLTLIAVALLRAGAAAAQTKAVSLAIDGRANANPSIAAQGRFVAVAWSAATATSMDIFAATSRDGGATFAAPVRVNDVPGDARAGSEQPPRIVLVPHKGADATPDIVVVWTTKAPAGTRLLSARSGDGGHAFGASRIVPGSDGSGSRGWESVAVDGNGRVVVLWLDHRETAPASAMHHGDSSAKMPAAATAPKADPTERAGLSKLYVAALDGSTATPITGGVCYCCKTSLIASGNDVFGVWRHVYAGSQRDIAFTASHDGGKTFAAPVRVSDDGWHIDGCPENGPALAVDREHRIHVAWPTPPDGKSETPLGLFLATSADGKRFGPRTQIPTHGPAAHVQLAMGLDGSLIVVWDEVDQGGRHLAATRVRLDASNKPSFVTTAPPDGTTDQGWPVLAAAATNVVIGWASGTGIGSTIRVAQMK